MFVKVLAGHWGECTAGFGGGWTGRMRIVLPGGATYFTRKDVVEVAEISAREHASAAGMAGWTILGAATLGAVGALAGLLRGGRGTEVAFAVRFADGKELLATADRDTFQHFKTGAAARAMNESIRMKGGPGVTEVVGMNAGDVAALSIAALGTAVYVAAGFATLSLH